MPELPEVETVRRGVAACLPGQQLLQAELQRLDLRWPIPAAAVHNLVGRRCHSVDRRAKYLLLRFDGANEPVALIHLGMSGRLLVEPRTAAARPPEYRRHEHWRFQFTDYLVRFVDPRRFGALDVAPAASLATHPLLCHLGREPLASDFDGEFLFAASRQRRCSIKSMLMDGCLLVGVGNIYASEACFRAGLRPRRAARSLRRSDCAALAAAVREVLTAAIAAGGTSFRDYVGVAEDAGYFARELCVYERAGQACRRCQSPIRRTVDHGRSSYWCPGCQH